MVVSFPAVLVIAGTTAVGKTDLSLELTKMLNGEIVSADSVQVWPDVANLFSEQTLHLCSLYILFLKVYKRLDVGSAKVDVGVCSQVSHHLLNVSSVREQFNAGDFYRLAEQAIQVSTSTPSLCSLQPSGPLHHPRR